MRKRFNTATLLTLVLSLLCAGALAEIEPVDVIGPWYLTGMQMGDAVISPALIGMEMAVVLEEGNIAQMHMSFGGTEDSTQGTWVIIGDQVTITADDDTSIVCTLAEGVLNAEQEDGTVMIFSRETAEEPAAFEASPINANAVLADFNGTWSATFLESGGTQLPVSTLGFDTTLIVEDGKATITNAFGNNEAEGNVEDGVLLLQDENGDVNPVYLHVDGTLSFVIDESTAMYFEKAGE